MANCAFVAISLLCATLSGCFLGLSFLREHQRRSSKEYIIKASVRDSGVQETILASSGLSVFIIRYLVRLRLRLEHKNTVQFSNRFLRLSRLSSNKNTKRIQNAGLASIINVDCLREGSLRLSCSCMLLCALLGACFSNDLMILFAIAGLFLGLLSPRWAVKQETVARSNELKRELPEMLEVVRLGLGSGLSFDRSFALYATYFDTAFSRACDEAYKKWSMGILSREDALECLGKEYDSALLTRTVQTICRSMKFGTSLSEDLEASILNSRAEQKTARQEQVAKIPVRMMIPTACLILPAMLLLVLGPVLIELVRGF